MISLLKYYSVRPWKYKEILILYHFRKERDKKAGYQAPDVSEQQYIWVQSKVKASLPEIKYVVQMWIFDFPNQYLKKCMYPGVTQFFSELKKRNILTAIYSDYDSKQKMEAFEIDVNMIVSSTDRTINAFKPVPRGLNYILDELKINHRENCLFIGDRDELDGACARAAGIPFILVDKKNTKPYFYNKLSDTLSNLTPKT